MDLETVWLAFRSSNLSYNSFGGSIPSEVRNLSNLHGTLDLSQNFFTGEIPASLGNLSEKLSNANSQTSFHNPFQSSSGNSIESGKDDHSSSHQVIKAVAFVIVGVCFIGFMFSYWYKKSSVCNGVQKVTSYRLEEKLIIGRDTFCFMKRDNDTLSENMEQCNFVPIDTEVDFDLEQLLKASTFLLGKSSNGILYKVVLNNGFAVAVIRLGDGEKSGIPFKPLLWPVRVQIMKGIAKGLPFLHEFSPKRYVHGNLKPNNILLDENMEPHISDFGLGRLANITDESPEFQSGEEDNISNILKLALACTHKSPDRRPSMRYVSYGFEKLTS
ncbi:hypothetical protein GQ457_04G022980 [Hibiscus cannabinus]